MAIREMGKEGLDVATEVSHDHPQRMEMWKCLKPLVSGLNLHLLNLQQLKCWFERLKDATRE